jgi:hypothetical protein
MTYFPIFLSVVLVVRNQSKDLNSILSESTAVICSFASDYELIVVDNASGDNSVSLLKKLTSEGGLPNLQIYALTKEVDTATASWVGLENALGDFVAVIDPASDDVNFLPSMLEHALEGVDVVFASNEQRTSQSLIYSTFSTIFNKLYQSFNHINLAKQAPSYRVLSKRVVNFILQHPLPQVTYRHLPATGGFTKMNLNYSTPPRSFRPERLGESIDRGMRLLVSTTRGPMRLVTMLSMFGAVANLFYSIYVISIALLKPDVASGWITLSLQQSGMFFLFSLVLLILGEYILHMTIMTNEGPTYHIAQEFTSAVMTRHEKLNIEEASETKRHAKVKPEL